VARAHQARVFSVRGVIWLSASDAADSFALIRHCLCAGKYTASDGEADCVACGAGKYAASPLSATACVDCAVGKHLESAGNDAEVDCVACAAGADSYLALPQRQCLYFNHNDNGSF